MFPVQHLIFTIMRLSVLIFNAKSSHTVKISYSFVCNSLALVNNFVMSMLPASFYSSRRIGELMNEVINKYGVVWVSSAGNNGPALCTVSCPPNISTTSVIGTHFLITFTIWTHENSYMVPHKRDKNQLTKHGFTSVYHWTDMRTVRMCWLH